MFHISKSTINLHFNDFMIHTPINTDKVLRCAENNQVDFSEHLVLFSVGERNILSISMLLFPMLYNQTGLCTLEFCNNLIYTLITRLAIL